MRVWGGGGWATGAERCLGLNLHRWDTDSPRRWVRMPTQVNVLKGHPTEDRLVNWLVNGA